MFTKCMIDFPDLKLVIRNFVLFYTMLVDAQHLKSGPHLNFKMSLWYMELNRQINIFFKYIPQKPENKQIVLHNYITQICREIWYICVADVRGRITRNSSVRLYHLLTGHSSFIHIHTLSTESDTNFTIAGLRTLASDSGSGLQVLPTSLIHTYYLSHINLGLL